MAEGTDNVEDRLSCDDSSYDEDTIWTIPTAAMVFAVEVRTRNTAVTVQTRWEWSRTGLNRLPPYTTLQAVAARTTT